MHLEKAGTYYIINSSLWGFLFRERRRIDPVILPQTCSFLLSILRPWAAHSVQCRRPVRPSHRAWSCRSRTQGLGSTCFERSTQYWGTDTLTYWFQALHLKYIHRIPGSPTRFYLKIIWKLACKTSDPPKWPGDFYKNGHSVTCTAFLEKCFLSLFFYVLCRVVRGV